MPVGDLGESLRIKQRNTRYRLAKQLLVHLPVNTQAKKIAELANGINTLKIMPDGHTEVVYQRPPDMDAIKAAIELTSGRQPQEVSVKGEINHTHTMKQIIVPEQKKPRRIEDAKIEVLASLPPLVMPDDAPSRDVQS